MNFETTKQSPSSVRPHHETGRLLWMIQLGKDSCFYKKCFQILRVGDSFRVWHLDGDRAIQIIVVSKIDPVRTRLDLIDG